MRALAYTVEVKPDDLKNIRTEYFKSTAYHFNSYKNVQLVHYYSVILNRYDPNTFYRDRIILTDYVFDGLLKRNQLLQNDELNAALFLELIHSIVLMKESKQDEAINRIAIDFKLYTDESVKQEITEWGASGLPFEINDVSYFAVLQRFLNAIENMQ